MLVSITKKITVEKEVSVEINDFVMNHKEKNITSTQLLYIPPVIIPIQENDPIKTERGMENASYTETRGYFLFIAYYESKF